MKAEKKKCVRCRANHAEQTQHHDIIRLLKGRLRGCSVGFKKWRRVPMCAALKGHAHCLDFAITTFHRMHGACEDVGHRALRYALKSGSMDCVELLASHGYKLPSGHATAAAAAGNWLAIIYCLLHLREDIPLWKWDDAMVNAIFNLDTEVMLVLYNHGNRAWRDGTRLTGPAHPACLAISAGTLEGARIAVKYSGAPPAECVDTARAALRGQALLEYAHELVGGLLEGTAEATALSGDVGALRYAHEHGAQWDGATLLAALEGDSLECLQYAHERGCPHHLRSELGTVAQRWNVSFRTYSYTGRERWVPKYVDLLASTPWEPVFVAAQSLPVLQYASEHMGPTWGEGVLHATCDSVARRIRQGASSEDVDGLLALYTAKGLLKSGKVWADLPAPLAEYVRERRKKAVAFAAAFDEAGRLADKEAAHPWSRTWRSMANLPDELRQKIASMAHLALPVPPPRGDRRPSKPQPGCQQFDRETSLRNVPLPYRCTCHCRQLTNV